MYWSQVRVLVGPPKIITSYVLSSEATLRVNKLSFYDLLIFNFLMSFLLTSKIYLLRCQDYLATKFSKFLISALISPSLEDIIDENSSF